ncbi:hypothetical protein YC2023_101651 [Brassica napus]
MAADNSAPIDLDVSKNAPIIAQEASIVSGQAYISESVLKTNVQGVFSATNTPTSPLKDVSFTEVLAVPETGRVLADPLVGEKIVQSSDNVLSQNDSLLTTSDEVVQSFQTTDIVITDAEHTVPSSCRSGKTTKSRKEASGFATGSEANVKSLRGESYSANQFAALDWGSDMGESEDPEDDISTNLTTPFTDSLLRDRPVKLSTKATEMAATLHATRGRGKRGRGRRGRLG